MWDNTYSVFSYPEQEFQIYGDEGRIIAKARDVVNMIQIMFPELGVSIFPEKEHFKDEDE